MAQKKQLSYFFKTAIFPLLLLVAFLAGCREKSPILIGYVGPITGRFADLGIAGRDGVMLAIEEVNGRGGIRGRKVQIITKDDGQNVQQALKVDRELVDAGVVAIVGHMTSAMSVAALPVANRARVLMVSPTTSSNELTGIDDYFIRLYPPSRDVAKSLSTLVFERGVHSLAIVYDMYNKPHALGFYSNFSDNYRQLGGRMTNTLPINDGKPDFAALAKQVGAGGAEGVFVIAGAVDTAMFCQHLRNSGSSIPVFVSEWSTTNELLNLGGAAVEGITFYQTFDRDDGNAGFQAFKKKYTARFGREPTFASIHAYDSMQLIIDGLMKDLDPAQLKKTIITAGKFRGLQDEIAIDRYGDPRRRFFLTTIKSGSFQRVR